MAASLSSATPPNTTDRRGWYRTDRMTATLWGLVVLALLPLWYTYYFWTSKEGHYQYFPLLIAACVYLYVARFGDAVRASTAPDRRYCLIALAALLVLISVALLLFGPFLAILATIAAVSVWTYGVVGWGGMVSLMPVLGLLVLAIPMPMGLDNALIFSMQMAASRLASLLLDGCGILHVREGALLITEQARYMTEEACSGVRSLFSTLAVVAVYSVVANHHWSRTTVNLIQSIFWVLVGNSLRVALCVFLADNVSPWYASGTGHELLSLGIFGFILAMVVNTDASMRKILPSRWNWYHGEEQPDWVSKGGPNASKNGPPASHPMARSNVSPQTDQLVWGDGVQPIQRPGQGETAGQGQTGGGPTADEPSDDPKIVGTLKAALDQQVLDQQVLDQQVLDQQVLGQRDHQPSPAISTFHVLAGAALVALGIFVATIRTRAPVSASMETSQQRLPALSDVDLPPTIAGWKQDKFEHVTRERNDIFANHSYTWDFSRGDLAAVISVDCPWASWHDLAVCYGAIGWNVQPDYFVATSQELPYPNLSYSDLSLRRPQGTSSGRVLFTVVDRQRNEVTANQWRHDLKNPIAVARGLFRTMLGSLGLQRESVLEFPATTIQVFAQKGTSLTDQDVGHIRSLFFESRKLLLEGRRWQPEQQLGRQLGLRGLGEQIHPAGPPPVRLATDSREFNR